VLNILAAVLLFGFIVLVHEFGHFLLAKCSGIGVVEFSVGMGPRIFSVEKGETRYSIKALPFGGSCMMVGEDSENPGSEGL
jgi:Predicted membrane-associated Zn-dependent proteases 1